MDRRRFVAALGAGAVAAAGADAWLVEPRRLQVTRHQVDSRPGAARVTFAQITDLHLQRVGGLHRRLAAAVGRAHPRFVVFTGDSIDHAEKLPVLDEFLSLLDPRVPKLAIVGNWERWAEVDPVDRSDRRKQNRDRPHRPIPVPFSSAVSRSRFCRCPFSRHSEGAPTMIAFALKSCGA